VNRNWVIEQLKKYSSEFSEEQVFVTEFLALLKHPDAFQRHHLPGHITGSKKLLASGYKIQAWIAQRIINKRNSE
jgi:hypothetical protein